MRISALNICNNILNPRSRYIQAFTSKAPEITSDSFDKDCCCKFDLLPTREVKIPSKTHSLEYIKIINTEQGPIGYRLPEYFILYLESFKKGDGTKAIQNVVRTSLSNPETQGRVSLYADKINPKQKEYPGGFYYKLGFRFVKPELNRIFNEWINNGGKRKHSPKKHGAMYLPKANIEYCLNY